MANFAPITNRNNFFINQNNINAQNIYNFMNLKANLINYNNNNNNNNNNMGMHFNKDSKITKQNMRINKTPATKGQYSNRNGYPFYNDSNMNNHYFNSPAAPTYKEQSFSGSNKKQPYILNNYNINVYQNQPFNINNNKINLNNNIITNKSKDNKINNFINNNNNNNTNSRNQNNLASTEEDYTLEVLESKRIFRTKTKNYTPFNQKLDLKNKDNNITDLENDNFCKGNTNNDNRNTVFYINQAFNTQK